MFEEFTEEYFLKKAKDLGDEIGIDTRTGSVYMDMAAGHCLRAAFFFANLTELFNMFALDTCYADVLDDKANEWGLERHPATPAQFKFTLKGVPEEGYDPDDPDAPDDPPRVQVKVSVGTRFFAEGSGYYFFVVEDDDENQYLEAETDGSACNVLSAGTEIVPVDDIDDLEEAVLGEIYTPGADEETDDDLRTRLREKIAGPAENGNRQHYKTWCESIDGVGRARIDPLFAGENTVRGILFSPDGGPVGEAVVAAVQEYIDPIVDGYVVEDRDGNSCKCGDGLGDGVANIGAHFFAMSAKILEILVSFTVVLKDGFTLEECKAAATEAVTNYLQDLSLETGEGEEITIRISAIGAMISDLEMVLDYYDLTLNGGTTNVVVTTSEAPVLKGVEANAAS